MKTFREEEHPRDNDGKFKEKGGNTIDSLIDKYSDTPTEDKNKVNKKTAEQDYNKDKAIRSYRKQIEKHKEKIKNPQNYISDWDKKSEQYKKGIVNYWKKEINNFEKQIERWGK